MRKDKFLNLCQGDAENVDHLLVLCTATSGFCTMIFVLFGFLMVPEEPSSWNWKFARKSRRNTLQVFQEEEDKCVENRDTFVWHQISRKSVIEKSFEREDLPHWELKRIVLQSFTCRRNLLQTGAATFWILSTILVVLGSWAEGVVSFVHLFSLV